MFAIARIVELMQQTVNAEEETEVLKKRLDDVGEMASKTTRIPEAAEDAVEGAPQTIRRRRGNNGTSEPAPTTSDIKTD